MRIKSHMKSGRITGNHNTVTLAGNMARPIGPAASMHVATGLRSGKLAANHNLIQRKTRKRHHHS